MITFCRLFLTICPVIPSYKSDNFWFRKPVAVKNQLNGIFYC
jgi:hypothetical protein